MPQAPDRLLTNRLVGSRIARADLEDFKAFYADPAVMRRLSPTGTPFTAEAATELFDGHLKHWEEYGYGTWIFRDADGAFCGRAGLRSMDVDGARQVELFYGVASDRWGRGLATEIARAIIAVSFDEFGLDQLVAFALPTNGASLRVLEKCGFVEDGELVHAGLRHGLFRLRRR